MLPESVSTSSNGVLGDDFKPETYAGDLRRGSAVALPWLRRGSATSCSLCAGFLSSLGSGQKSSNPFPSLELDGREFGYGFLFKNATSDISGVWWWFFGFFSRSNRQILTKL